MFEFIPVAGKGVEKSTSTTAENHRGVTATDLGKRQVDRRTQRTISSPGKTKWI